MFSWVSKLFGAGEAPIRGQLFDSYRGFRCLFMSCELKIEDDKWVISNTGGDVNEDDGNAEMVVFVDSTMDLERGVYDDEGQIVPAFRWKSVHGRETIPPFMFVLAENDVACADRLQSYATEIMKKNDQQNFGRIKSNSEYCKVFSTAEFQQLDQQSAVAGQHAQSPPQPSQSDRFKSLAPATPTRQFATRSDLENTPSSIASLPSKNQPEMKIGSAVVSATAAFFVLDSATGSFLPHTPELTVSIQYADAPAATAAATVAYVLQLTYKNECVYVQRLGRAMDIQAYEATNSIVWQGEIPEAGLSVFSCVFNDVVTFGEFRDVIGRCVFEIETQLESKDIRPEDLDWFISAMNRNEEDDNESADDGSNLSVYSDVGMEDAPELDLSPEPILSTPTRKPRAGSQLVSPSRVTMGGSSTPEGRFKNLNVAEKHDRTFVFRGSSMGVFGNDDENRLFVVGKKEVGFSPSSALLTGDDSAMMMLSPSSASASTAQMMSQLDTERNSIVSAYEVSGQDDRPLSLLAPSKRFNTDGTLLGMSEKELLLLDPRQRNVVAARLGQGAKGNAKFSSMMSTGDGDLAVGAQDGTIRLYSKNWFESRGREVGGIGALRAKTNLPGVGFGAVRGIDVSADGEWVLATYPDRLLLIHTLVEGTSGFRRGLPLAKREKPRQLSLKRSDALKLAPVSFMKATFNTSPEGETSIVTSTGRTLVVWDFEKVKKNKKLSVYKLLQFDQQVSEQAFQHGNNRNNMVIALENDMCTAGDGTGGVVTPWKSRRRGGQ